jgi:5-methylcytosine-specific restriction endonuclease McrA
MHPNTIKRRQRKKVLINLLGGKCKRCGSKKHLEFDHLDPNDKKFKVSEMLDWGELNLHEEAKKCQLLCKPCHHLKTLENLEYGAEAPHGSLWRYRKYKCRCDLCSKANDEYNNHRRDLYHKILKIQS